MALSAACVSVGLSLVSTFLLVPFFKYIARVTRLLDVPDGILKNHKQPVPYLGGVAVFFGCLVPFFYFFSATVFDQWHFFTGLLVLLIVGLLDDIYRISPAKKFAGQLVACVIFIKGGALFNKHIFSHILPLPVQSPELFSVLNGLLSAFWILTCINAFNLIDIMDGLASSVAFVSALFFIGTALFFNVGWLAAFLGCFCAALCAFFWYNKPPATMYLGDAGSLWIGGALACMPFFLHWGASFRGQLLVPLFFLAVPLIEICSLIIIRTSKKIPFYYGSPHHFICYLKKRGWNTVTVLLLTIFTAALFGALGFFVAFQDIALSVSTLCFLLGTFLWVFSVFFI